MNDRTGVKHRDLRHCVGCGKGMMHANNATFFRGRIDYMLVDMGAVQRAHGMEMMMGGGQAGAVLANVMGRDEDLAKQVASHEFFACLPCSSTMSIWEIYERAGVLVERENEKAKEESRG